jgi:hypothetical protein
VIASTARVLFFILANLICAISQIAPLSIDARKVLGGTLKLAIALIVSWTVLIPQTFNLAIGFMPKLLLGITEQPIPNLIEEWLTIR